MNFYNFFTIYVFEVREFIFDIPTKLPCSGDFENPSQLISTWNDICCLESAVRLIS